MVDLFPYIIPTHKFILNDRLTKRVKGSDDMPKKKNIKIPKAVRPNKSLKIYTICLAVLTLLLGVHVLNNVYLQPRSTAGSPIYGSRLDLVDEISSDVLTATEQFGLNQGRVEEVDVTIIGKVVYFNVRVAAGTDILAARTQAEEIANFFLTQAGDDSIGYNLQLVVSTGDIEELKDENRAGVQEHVRLNAIRIIEEVSAYAELYPTHYNINRITENVTVYRQVIGAELADEYIAYANTLTPLTAEEETLLVEENDGEPLVLDLDRKVPITNITQFPSWGAFDVTTGEFEWN